MFGSRRHRPPNPPLTAATADPNAATAAAAVFKRHEPNSSLSAAAAAAALRARPTTPTRVADVQTKRTLRRSASVASASTASDYVHDRPRLHRRGSSSSMTERTFRTPSPHRPSSSGFGQRRAQPVRDDMPPVPALPRKNMDAASRQGVAQQENRHRKASSLGVGSTPVRVASQKLASGEAPSWFGAAKLGDLGNVRRTDPAMASPPSSPLQVFTGDEELPEAARPGSQASSINFSYPIRTRRGSSTAVSTADEYDATQMPAHTGQVHPHVQDQEEPARAAQFRNQPRVQSISPSAGKPPASTLSDQSLVYDPNSRRMVPRANLLVAQQAVIDATQAAMRRKKKKRLPQRAGSHLAAGTMGRARIAIPSSAPAAKIAPHGGAAQAQLSRQAQTTPHKEPAPAKEALVRAEEPAVEEATTSPTVDANRSEQQHPQQATELPRNIAPAVSNAAQFVVRRQPSVVREEPEPEDSGNERPTQKLPSALDAVPGRRTMQVGAGLEAHSPPSTTMPPNGLLENLAVIGVDQKPKTGSVHVSEDGKPQPGATEHGWDARVLRDRTHSNSPARQAHFGPVQDNLTVKHSPPPRSISPRKSAMKHTSSPRAASPSDDTSEASGNASQEPLIARRKSVRVSFDECALGAAADSVSASGNNARPASSPLHGNRQNWLANVSRNQDLSSFDDDAVMKPRPALPSFGSVRDRKPRDISPDLSERPLVRPKGETRYPPALLPNPPLGSSNDHALGAVLSKEQARPTEGNVHAEGTPRNREPLPPVVTSVEGTGYFTDTSDNSSVFSSEFEQPEALSPKPAPEPRSRPIVEPQSEVHKTPVNGLAGHSIRDIVPVKVTMEPKPSMEPQVPAISVSQQTPPTAEDKSPTHSYMDVPGRFPEDESDQSAASAADTIPQVRILNTSAEVSQQGNPPSAAETSQPTVVGDFSDSESEVYSDAYEDLSEIEGDGFQSLNAVVESPLQKSPRLSSQAGPAACRDAARHKSPGELPKFQTQLSSATTAVETQPAGSPEDDWERAKAWWRSLTSEKRAELEREAIEEAVVKADRNEPPPEAEVNKKKTVERSVSETRVLAAHMAQRTSAKQEQERAANPHRSCMVKPGEQWTRKNKRDIPPMRKTMRGEPQHHVRVKSPEGSLLRKSMRPSGPSGPSSDAPVRPGDQATSKRPVPSPLVAAVPARPKHGRSATQVEAISHWDDSLRPSMARRGSSGSESSFKRSRTARDQGVGFRSSMRPTSPPSVHGDARYSRRFSLRALSPTGPEPRQTADHSLAGISENTHMRTTLRDQFAARKSSGGIRIPSFNLSYGGGKKHGSKTSENKGPGSRFSSRFADSSDEEGPGPLSSFRSRFEDSSDDEPVMPVPAPLSIPASTSTSYAATGGVGGHHLRKESSIASTALPEELEDSEETQEHGEAAAAETRSGLPAFVATVDTSLRSTRSGMGQFPDSQTAPLSVSGAADSSNKTDNNKKIRAPRRNSIMSMLRHRKKDSSAGKIGRPEIRESAARQDTRLERSVGQLEQIRSQGSGEEGDVADEAVPSPSPSPSPKSPRLQKRGGNKRGSSSGVAAMSKTTTAAATPESGMGMPAPTPTVGAAPPRGHDNDVLVGGNNREEDDKFKEDASNPAAAQLRRSSTSGNLGTRTLSGAFLQLHSHHLHHHHRRAPSISGLEAAPASVEGSVAGSMEVSSSTTRKKRFGTLRRMFGISD
ncbi:hypothetical protein N657DRAFT_670778 [Parathielavia appendiculata]|uniref:Uncharacterized protein n=1 Tax=Parathielavia appendiculata TaxID=2587402 RepID=A0AAN6U4E8_9PEZI|nr:hypothetical protein N657DRAFT_670778 [Parathielavia appendiculata]